MSRFKVLRGLRDYLPNDVAKRLFIINVLRDLFRVYGYEEVGTPTLETFELISAKVGDEIRHRMYAFTDLGGRKVALRPEMTAPIARLVATKLRMKPKPLRLSYIANCFRYDNPQAGRFREFWQAGFELFGSPYPEADTEILTISRDLMDQLGFKDYWFRIGHVGVMRGFFTEEGVDEKTQNTIMGLIDKGQREKALDLLFEVRVSEECLRIAKKLFRLKGTDAEKVVSEGKALFKDYTDSIKALENFEEILDLFLGSTKAKVEVDLGSARGLEYYTGMIFEVYIPEFHLALNGGGRYDELVKLFGGGDIPAVGCAPGIDRIIIGMDRLGLFPKKPAETKVLVTATSRDLQAKALEVANLMRSGGIRAECEVMRRDVKRTLSYAGLRGFTSFVLIGPRELKENKVVIRDLIRREQKIVPIDKLVEAVRRLAPFG